MKECTKCHKLLDESMFYKCKNNKDGLAYECKDCRKAYMAVYSKMPKSIARVKAYQESHKEEIKVRRRERYQKNREEILACRRVHYVQHREEILAENRKYAAEHRDYYRNYEKNYRQKRKKLWQENKLDLNFLKNVGDSLKFCRPTAFCYQHLPYSYYDLRKHLEKQFTSKMSWGNYGSYWELDHIIPRRLFNIQDYESKDFKICWSLANIRPLSISENRQRLRDGSDVSEQLKQKILLQNL